MHRPDNDTNAQTMTRGIWQPASEQLRRWSPLPGRLPLRRLILSSTIGSPNHLCVPSAFTFSLDEPPGNGTRPTSTSLMRHGVCSA
jgi:hypothetical protein